MARRQIPRYLNNTPITSMDELPIPYSERISTDVFCTVCSAILAIAMFVFAIVVFNAQKLRDITYPTDQIGRKCTLDHVDYNYLYFVSVEDITRRVCVSECPSGDDQRLKCWPTDNIGCGKNNNPAFEVMIYDAEPSKTSLGLFCLPKDEQLKNKILENSQMDMRFNFVKAYRLIWIFAGVAAGISILFLISLFCIPRFMFYAAIGLGALGFLLISGILFYECFRELKGYKIPVIIIAFFFIILAIMLISSLCRKNKLLELAVTYVEKGMNVLKDEPGLFLMIPVFIIFNIGLLALCAFQHFAFWSSSDIAFDPHNIYYTFTGGYAFIMQIINLIEFIWGLCFLKSAYNYLIAGCGVTYYTKNTSYFSFGLRGLLCFHWGSVVGGSFLINFFYFPDLLFDAIKPNEEDNPGEFQTFMNCCGLCDRFFGLIREQTMAFINLVGLPYCNSSRITEKIYFFNEDPIDGSESQAISRYFRLGAHSLIATITFIIFFFYMNSHGNMYLPILLFSYLINIFIATFFICLIADMLQTLMTCELVNLYFQNRHQKQEPDNLNESTVKGGYDMIKANPY